MHIQPIIKIQSIREILRQSIGWIPC